MILFQMAEESGLLPIAVLSKPFIEDELCGSVDVVMTNELVKGILEGDEALMSWRYEYGVLEKPPKCDAE